MTGFEFKQQLWKNALWSPIERDIYQRWMLQHYLDKIRAITAIWSRAQQFGSAQD